MKKLLSLILALSMTVMMLVGCQSGGSTEDTDKDNTAKSEDSTSEKSDIKVGIIYIGDENEGYTEAHMTGIKEMKEALGLSDDQVIEVTNIPEDQTCYDTAKDLVGQGCNVIFANSFGHEDYMIEAAKEFPDVEFCHATGFKAASSGLSNMHNYFTAFTC